MKRSILTSVLLFLAASCSSSSSNSCSLSNCSGCCDASGRCQTGAEPTACGTDGVMCSSCALGLSCARGQCLPPSPQSGGGTGSTGGGGGSVSYTNDWAGVCLASSAEPWRMFQSCGENDPDSTFIHPTYCDSSAGPPLTSDQAARCIAAFQGLNCRSPTSSFQIAGCEEVIRAYRELNMEKPGTLGLNAPCARFPSSPNETCQPGLYCEDQLSCPSRCLSRLSAGQVIPPNVSSQRCQEGLYRYNGRCTVPSQIGESCAQSRQCVPEAHCNKDELCVPFPTQRLAVGQSCSTIDFCEIGTFCDRTTETCTRHGGLNAPCSTSRPCASWLICGINNECTKPGKFGAVCRSRGDCDSDFTCDIASGATVGVCNPSRLPIGSACAYSTASRCDTGTYCTATGSQMTGVCAAHKLRGAPCRFDAPRDECDLGLDCTAISSANPDGVCAAPSALGGPCRRRSDSFSTISHGCDYTEPLYCRPTGTGMEGVCATPKPAGSPCSYPADYWECQGFCNATSSAPSGICVTPRAAGAPCRGESDRECIGGTYCSALTTPNGVCTPRKLAGVSCTLSEECYGGCVEGSCEGCPR